MAAGKRYKFSGTTIAVLTSFAAESPSSGITAVTRANPAVVTDSNHGLQDGDVIKPSGVVGMTELNDSVFVVNVLDANTFELVGVDSTGYGAYVSGGTYLIGQFSNFCELTNYNRQGGTSPEIDATSLCSTAAEFELGLPDFGTTQLDYNFAPTTAIQQAIQEFYLSGDVTAVHITLPNSGGEMVQLGFIQQTSETAGNGGLWAGSMTIRNTGNRYDVEA
jgi:hypothetical protein